MSSEPLPCEAQLQPSGLRFTVQPGQSLLEAALASGILHKSTIRLLRSTNTPTADLFPAPLIKSPSQCPGMRRSLTSGGRTWMLTISGI